MKPHKFILELEPEFNFELIGIISSVRDYTLAWYMNKYLEISLRKDPDIEFVFLKDCIFYISNYIFEANYSLIRLIKNRPVEFKNSKKPYLLPELSSYDYFLLLEGVSAEHVLQQEVILKNIPVVSFAKRIEYQQLPSAENLLFK